MMYFHGGYQETLWFRPWHTASASQFLASLVLLACICIIHEAITALRVRFHAHLAAGSLRLPGMVFPSSSSPPPSLLSETTAQRAALLESHGSTMHVGDASPAPKGPLLMNSRDPATAIVARLGTGTPLRAVVCVLYGFNVLLSYMLMLAVMTFNTWYMAVLVVGLAVGHFVCYPLRADSEQASADGCCVR